MRFDEWTIEQKTDIDIDYQNRFGGQIRVLKKLYKTKQDPILLDELLENVSSVLFQAMQLQGVDHAEALLERMFLSVLEYDIIIFDESELNEYTVNVYFYNDYQTLEYSDIRIKNAYDIKKLIRMILHIGIVYDKLLNRDPDAEKHLNDYRLLEGFDSDFVPESGQGHTTKNIN
ncbi:MAG TPA: hypothetical protein DEG42_02825 [Acholeplasmataceae bacterium]|nr:MAG: hypothetical protein A2013_04835 [Tenericutes bacterium GWE2_38_8]OHE40817.1 MAG: hypothetical protein A2102_05985 [Tenericutes bacterium GWF2_38_8]HBG32132.1 hypothetical protein [Acholeplasmataceae bacterium]HBY65313.1 hypothetical protein [Acholeplasmataceae bacterium]HCB66454.1 hypothetical protein [Acholeplasmataceae bacterium]